MLSSLCNDYTGKGRVEKRTVRDNIALMIKPFENPYDYHMWANHNLKADYN